MFKNIIYQGTLVFVVAIFLSLPLVKIPLSTSSRGVVRSLQENTHLNPVISGRVVKTGLIKNNQEIKKGDTLLIVTTQQLDTQKQLQKNQRDDYALQLNDLNKVIKGQYNNLQTGQYQKEVSAMQQKIAHFENQLSLAKNDLDRATVLFEQGVIPRAEYDKIRHDYSGFKEQISGVREQQMAQWQSQKREVERQLRTLNSEIQRIGQEQENYVITAPISGRLVDFSGIQKGNFLVQGQNIGEISPEGHLVAECLVSPREIGFINTGQQVKFQMDTYNYNQWGLLEGEVLDIDQNIKVNQQTGEAYFRVLCKMKKDYLQLKSGYKGYIKKGMTFTVRFYLLDRTLWQLLFDKIDNWFNPKFKGGLSPKS